MKETSIDGFEIRYPAPLPLVLDGKELDKKLNEEAEKLAYGCNIYEVSKDGDEYILHSQFKLYHFRYKGGVASCSCGGFNYATGKPAAMCVHIAAFLKTMTHNSTRIKPLDSKPGLRGLIEKFCHANNIECKLPSGSPQDNKEKSPSKEAPKPPEQGNVSEPPKGESPKATESNVTGEPKTEDQAANKHPEKEHLSYLCKGGQHAGCGGYECSCPCHKKGAEKVPEKKEEKPGENLPAKQEPAKPPARKKTDAEIDAEIEMAKAGNVLI